MQRLSKVIVFFENANYSDPEDVAISKKTIDILSIRVVGVIAKILFLSRSLGSKRFNNNSKHFY